MRQRLNGLRGAGARVAPLALLLLAVTTAQAASLGWMKGETASFFTDRDWELVRETLDATLAHAADGETREWSNPKSGARGSMTPVTTEMHGDVTCRRLRIESMARGSSSSGAYLFCRRGDGAWGFGRPEG